MKCVECHKRPIANKKRSLCTKCYQRAYKRGFDDPKNTGSLPIILDGYVIITEKQYKELLYYKSKINPKEYTIPYSKKKIYFIQNEEGYIKIGQSIDPHRRLKELQTSSASKLKILTTVYGKDGFEGILHKTVKRSKINGEWYKPDENFFNGIKRFGIDIKINIK